MSSVAGRNVYDADQWDALEKLINSAGAGGSKPFIKFRFFPRNSSQNPPPEVRFALNDPPRSIEIKTNEKDELYLAYIDLGHLSERQLLRCKTVDDIRNIMGPEADRWRRAKWDIQFRPARERRLPARFR